MTWKLYLVAEIKLNRKKIFIVLSYRHPNMPNDEIVDYIQSLKSIYESIKKENSTVCILCGDFNSRSPVFWEGDIENESGSEFNDFLISNDS